MLNITNELKAKLLAAQSAEEVTELLKANGREIIAEETETLWEEIERVREEGSRKLSKDEQDAVSSGFGFDFPSGCTCVFTE